VEVISRTAADQAAELLAVFPALVIEGARQVGKSTLVSLLDPGRPTAVRTMDDPEVRDAAIADPRGFVDQMPDGLLVIDEVQRLPEITVAVKAAIDRDRRPGRFLLTGSADFLRQSATTDSLAGRAVTLRLLGLSQREYDAAAGDFPHALVGWLASRQLPDVPGEPRSTYLERIARGGYPAVAQLSDRTRAIWLDGYVSGLLSRDAVDLMRVEPTRLMTLIRLLAANQSGELVKARVARDAALPAASVTPYLDLLRRLFLIDLVPPWTPNLTRREVGRPKCVVTDPGLAARLVGATASSLEGVPAPASLGGLVEGLVVTELLAAATVSETNLRLYHYRDRNGVEVDLVAELDDGSVIGIEVKAAQGNSAAQFKGLRFLRDSLGDRFRGGVVLSMAGGTYRYAEGLWGLPISALWAPVP
jgi:predicted AAA+ superfamily ATPase